jgi:hypothetical protein
MKYKALKENILKLIDLKQGATELIQKIYHESGDIQLCIYTEDPITIFVENPRGFEVLAELFKKRISNSDDKIKGEYNIKKYFIYKNVEFFCLYKAKKKETIKRERWVKIGTSVGNFLKDVLSFLLGILKIFGKD